MRIIDHITYRTTAKTITKPIEVINSIIGVLKYKIAPRLVKKAIIKHVNIVINSILTRFDEIMISFIFGKLNGVIQIVYFIFIRESQYFTSFNCFMTEQCQSAGIVTFFGNHFRLFFCYHSLYECSHQQ